MEWLILGLILGLLVFGSRPPSRGGGYQPIKKRKGGVKPPGRSVCDMPSGGSGIQDKCEDE
jgi:hypothetical protein